MDSTEREVAERQQKQESEHNKARVSMEIILTDTRSGNPVDQDVLTAAKSFLLKYLK